VSGLVAPMLFGSALKIAIGVTVGLVASFGACQLAGRVGGSTVPA
jgi:DHA1 family bicyclomycin/chloramphenicol resistance-like MFS transporter